MNTRLIRIETEADKTSVSLDNGILTLTVDLGSGKYGIRWRDGSRLIGIDSGFSLDGSIRRASEYESRQLNAAAADEVSDAIGTGRCLTVLHTWEGLPLLRQQFTVYEEQAYITVKLEVDAESGGKLESNYMAPVLADASSGPFMSLGLPEGHALQALLVPFDNDKWVRYESVSMPGEVEGYEATALYDPASGKGMVMGSVTHDTWKTGLRVRSAAAGCVESLEIYGGAAGELSRDSIPHGAIAGAVLESPVILLGSFGSYRGGLEAFGHANAAFAPALPWEHGVPFGWNSWSAVGGKLDYDVYSKTSDFLRKLQDNGFNKEGIVYVNFDSFWNNLTPEQLEAAVRQVKDNGQKAGIYWTPFAFWGTGFEREVEGTEGRFTYNDMLLRDREGNLLPSLDGGLAIDPTHPGNRLRTNYHLKRFVDWGFDYVKLDFLGHGALEGSHHNPDIRTGIQAYNFGMDYIVRSLDPQKIGRPFHINLSIAPIFPHIYGHSRRISCDAFGTLADTEYMLNSLTYGWWMNGTIYRYNDPDHTVLYQSFNQEPTSYHEGRSRLNASVIAGTLMMMGDDFRKEEACRRAEEWLANQDIVELAGLGETFLPLVEAEGPAAANIFGLVRSESGKDCIYLAVFNFQTDAAAEITVPPGGIGRWEEDTPYTLKDLWSGAAWAARGGVRIELEPAESRLVMLMLE